jgi:SAM-dependent methyltransferase
VIASASEPTAPPVACAWCGASLRADGVRAAPGRLLCPACGVGTSNPWPSPAALDAAYAETYRPADGRFSWGMDALLRRTRARLARRLDRIAPPGAVLDVGAGDGTLLDALHARGREALGLERVPGARADVRAGSLDDLDERFAAIVFWHALEHLPDAGRALDRALELLDPGGVLLLAIPNLDSLQARLFGERWFGLDPPRHVVHLTCAALLERLSARGLRVERVRHLRGGQVTFCWLHGLVSHLPGRPDLYEVIRRPAARSRALSPGRRAVTVGAAGLLLPAALAGTAVEGALGRAATAYVEARRP